MNVSIRSSANASAAFAAIMANSSPLSRAIVAAFLSRLASAALAWCSRYAADPMSFLYRMFFRNSSSSYMRFRSYLMQLGSSGWNGAQKYRSTESFQKSQKAPYSRRANVIITVMFRDIAEHSLSHSTSTLNGNALARHPSETSRLKFQNPVVSAR